MAASTSTTAAVRIVALGGLGEIGLNLMAIECAGRAIVIDCGVMFPDEPALGLGTYIPEMAWLERSHVAVEAVVLTHAHEDHIGAIPHLLRRFNVPVYGTDITLAFTRRRLADAEFDDPVDLRTITPRHAFEAGPFTVEPIRVTHSTPNSIALAIRTPAGLIVHSGDFKIDDGPVDGEMFDRERFAELGARRRRRVALGFDQRRAPRPFGLGKFAQARAARDRVTRARPVFPVGLFVASASDSPGGRGLARVRPARRSAWDARWRRACGWVSRPASFRLRRRCLSSRARPSSSTRNRLSYLASGSQGEPLSALAKLAADAHPRVRIEHGDVVVLSSRFIPGNERTINTLVNRLYRQGAEVVYDAVAPVHVSGHASQDELVEMIALTRPRHFVPIHGEYRHLSRHLALAIAAGIPEHNCFLLEDGDSIVLSGGEARRGSTVEAGRVMLEGADGGDPAVVGERRVLARDGTVTAVLVLSSKTGRIIAAPISFRGGW